MRILIILSVLFLVAINTNYFWKYTLGLAEILAYLLLLSVFIFLLIMLILHLIKAINEKFQFRKRNILVVSLAAVLGLTIYKPFGLIDFKQFEGADLLVANNEGAANCLTSLHLKEDGIFIEEAFCFGPSKICGTYTIKNDTIWFSHNYDYLYAIVSKMNNLHALKLHREKKKTPIYFYIR